MQEIQFCKADVQIHQSQPHLPHVLNVWNFCVWKPCSYVLLKKDVVKDVYFGFKVVLWMALPSYSGVGCEYLLRWKPEDT